MVDLFSTYCFTLAFFLPGHGEWIILLVLGLLIFGRRLPEVGRSIGRSIVEFKKGIKGIEDDIEDSSSKEKPRIESSPSAQIGNGCPGRNPSRCPARPGPSCCKSPKKTPCDHRISLA